MRKACASSSEPRAWSPLTRLLCSCHPSLRGVRSSDLLECAETKTISSSFLREFLFMPCLHPCSFPNSEVSLFVADSSLKPLSPCLPSKLLSVCLPLEVTVVFKFNHKGEEKGGKRVKNALNEEENQFCICHISANTYPTLPLPCLSVPGTVA